MYVDSVALSAEGRKPMKHSRVALLIVSTVLVLLLVGGGLAFRAGATDKSFHQVSRFEEVFDLVQQNYVDPVNAETLLEGAYEGLLGGLDVNGTYLTPKEVEEWAGPAPDSADPGILVLKSYGALQVVRVVPGSPAEAAGIEKVGAMTPDIERIVALEPDLVVGASITAPEVIAKIEAAGVPFWVADSKDVKGVAESIRLLGDAVGLPEPAGALAQKLTERIDALTAKLAGAQRPRVFHELDATDPAKPFTVGPGNFVHDLITLAGGDNVFADAPTDYPQVSFEQVLARDPEVLILADAAFGGTAQAVKGRTGWEAISAVKNDRIFEVSEELGDQISRPGPRIADGLEALARYLHPQLFE